MRRSYFSLACVIFTTVLILFFLTNNLASQTSEVVSPEPEEEAAEKQPPAAKEEPEGPPAGTGEAGEPAKEPAQAFPVPGEVAGDSVNVRSGPGTNYSVLTKLNKGEQVVVLGEEFGWVKIEVPSATFSWISADFVERGEGNQGTVTANRVNIRAGSGTDFDILGQANSGDRIEIVDEVQGWYKISPPAGTMAWIRSDYIYYKEKAERPAPPPPPDDTPQVFARAEELCEAEMKKPIDQWDFSKVIPLYQDVLKRSQNPSLRYLAASRLRLTFLRRRFQGRKERIAQTDKRLQETRRKIEERKKQELAQIAARRPRVTYTATGRVEKLISSFQLGATHKLMRGKIAIYLLTSLKVDLNNFLGQEVNIKGKVEETLMPGVFVIRVDEVKLKRAP